MTWRWPRLRARPAVALLALFAGVGLAQGMMIRVLHQLQGGDPSHPVILFQLTGSLGAWIALPLVYAVVLNAQRFTQPDPGTIKSGSPAKTLSVRWWRFLGLHLAGYLCFTALHIGVMRAMRQLLFALSLATVPDGALGPRILWEMQSDMVVYGSAAAILTSQSHLPRRIPRALSVPLNALVRSRAPRRCARAGTQRVGTEVSGPSRYPRRTRRST